MSPVDDIAALKAALALAEARAKVCAESAAAWRQIACESAEDVGRLRQRLATLQGGAP